MFQRVYHDFQLAKDYFYNEIKLYQDVESCFCVILYKFTFYLFSLANSPFRLWSVALIWKIPFSRASNCGHVSRYSGSNLPKES